MLAGADFPPPKGFVNIVILILILDVFQHFYLCWLLPRLNKQNTFILNLGLFATVGIAVAVMMYKNNYTASGKLFGLEINLCQHNWINLRWLYSHKSDYNYIDFRLCRDLSEYWLLIRIEFERISNTFLVSVDRKVSFWISVSILFPD